jgi:predicted RNA-binding protein with PUA-like domain
MAYWLMKSEPDVFGIDDLRRKKTEGWNGVRNYLARNFMRAMRKGDLAFFYHSNAKPPGVVGVMEIVREAYPDPTQFDRKGGYFEPRSTPARPLWDQVDVRYVETLPRLVSLDELRAVPALATMRLFTHNRLSVLPISPEHWKTVLRLAQNK